MFLGYAGHIWGSNFCARGVISDPGCGSCRCGFPPVLAVAARRREPSSASPTALPFGVKSLGVICGYGWQPLVERSRGGFVATIRSYGRLKGYRSPEELALVIDHTILR